MSKRLVTTVDARSSADLGAHALSELLEVLGHTLAPPCRLERLQCRVGALLKILTGGGVCDERYERSSTFLE